MSHSVDSTANLIPPLSDNPTHGKTHLRLPSSGLEPYRIVGRPVLGRRVSHEGNGPTLELSRSEKVSKCGSRITFSNLIPHKAQYASHDLTKNGATGAARRPDHEPSGAASHQRQIFLDILEPKIIVDRQPRPHPQSISERVDDVIFPSGKGEQLLAERRQVFRKSDLSAGKVG